MAKRKNLGKKFESNFKKSLNELLYYYRLKDGTGAWDGGTKTRFQQTNMCDCFVYRLTKPPLGELFLIELKEHLGKSIPFSALRDNQIDELNTASEKGINACFVFFFSELEETYCIDAKVIKQYMNSADRKSFSVAWCKENGIYIPCSKKKVNYKYYLDDLFHISIDK